MNESFSGGKKASKGSIAILRAIVFKSLRKLSWGETCVINKTFGSHSLSQGFFINERFCCRAYLPFCNHGAVVLASAVITTTHDGSNTTTSIVNSKKSSLKRRDFFRSG